MRKQFFNVIYSLLGLFVFIYYAVVAAIVIENKVGGDEDSFTESQGEHEKAAESVRVVFYTFSCFTWGLVLFINIAVADCFELSEASLRSLGLNVFLLCCD